jgi:acetylornithine deacetylase/succinyl-diaminopimelate desuccinylase-like protein
MRIALRTVAALLFAGVFICACPLVPLVLLRAPEAPARAQAPSAGDRLARDILKELIEINTTDSSGSTTQAAEAMAARLRDAGFPAEDVEVLGPNPRKGNLVARLRGTGARRPILLLAHSDVVEARREDWSVDPFVLLEKDGYLYGRGTTDMKDQAASWIANVILYRQEGFKPNRDLIVALTADEETGDSNGVQWLLAIHRDLIDAEYAFNEGGGGLIENGRYLQNNVQAAEKVYLSFRLEVKNAGGHSSVPPRDNAIYHLARGLARLADFDFPVRLNEVTRAFFERTARIETGQMAADMRALLAASPDAAAIARLSRSPYYNALMRTTCVPTRLDGGHADNALPQTAGALVNCRLLPDESPVFVQQTLVRVLGDDQISVTPLNKPNQGPPSPLKPDVIGALEQVTESMWPGVPVIPVMGTGATDGRELRKAGIPCYGTSGLFEDVDDNRAHGRDERVGIKQFYEEREYLYRLIKTLASGPRS